MMKNLVFFFLFLVVTGCSKNDTTVAAAYEQLSNIAYGTDALQKMDLYLPAGRTTDSTRTIVLVHGGAWVEGDKTEFNSFIPVIQQRFPGYAIANINYRLASAGGNYFPTQENDMKAAIDFLSQKRADYRISEKLVLLGASAGAHMAMLHAYKYGSPSIRAVVDFFGPADMKALYDSTTNPTNKLGIVLLLGGTPSTNPSGYSQSSPLTFVTSLSTPTIIFHGLNDTIVPLSQSITLKTKLQNAGVTHQLHLYPNAGHELWPQPVMNDAFNKIQAFVNSVQ